MGKGNRTLKCAPLRQLYFTMVHPGENYKDIVILDSVSLRDLLLDQHLADELVSVGLERSRDLWVLALGERISIHPAFSNLLSKISQDFIKQWGLQEHSQYQTNIEFSTAQTTDYIDRISQVMVIEQLSESTTVRVSLSIKVSQSSIVHWDALLSKSNLSKDITSGLFDNTSKKDFCLYFLSKARGGDIAVKHWAQPSSKDWQDLLPKPTIDIFVKWLHSTKWNKRDLSIFQERMGLISGHRKTLEEVGQEFGVTRERVRQIIHRFIRHLSHPTRRTRLTPWSSYLKKLMQKHGGIMTLRNISSRENFVTDFEYFSPQPVIELIMHCCGMFGALEYDYEGGRGFSDIGSVIWYLKEIEPDVIRTTHKLAAAVVEKDPCRYGFEELVKKVCAESGASIEITRASLQAYELIEQDLSGLIVAAGKIGRLSIQNMAIIILREIGVPVHFSVITEKINARFPGRNLKPRDVHSRLDNPLFRWVDRGTYGLAEWDLPEIRPKENYASVKKAIKMVLQEMGRPATLREIEESLDKMTDEDHSFMLLSRPSIILYNNPQLFVSLGQSKWGLVEWDAAPKPAKNTVLLACEILAEGETAWLTIQQLYMEMKSRGWTAPISAVQRALDREVSKSKRRIRKEELHGFNIRLYGLSSRDWNEEAVLQNLLAD